MRERDLNILQGVVGAALVLAAWKLWPYAFTTEQRKAIKERDKNKCQFPAPHNCGGQLEVHHILCQRYLTNLGVDPDFAENAITICRNAHQEKVHPDMKKARKEYRRNKNSYREIFEQRDEMLRNREIYWNPQYDRQMQVVALRNTQRAKKEGWELPPKKEKVLYKAKKR